MKHLPETPPAISILSAADIDNVAIVELSQILREQILALQKLARNISSFLTATNMSLPDDLLYIIENSLQQIGSILQRLACKYVYVGVVGEISGGKSSFINNFLQKSLLPVEAVPGTTKIPVILANAPSHGAYALECQGLARGAGTSHTFRVESSPNIFVVAESVMRRAKANNQILLQHIEKYLMELNVTHACDAALATGSFEQLGRGIALVDIPSLGQIDTEASKCAKNIARICDALIVVTPLDVPLSKSLLADIKDITCHNNQACIFIGTRLDAISPDEIPRLKNFFAHRLQELSGHHPLFYFLSNLSGSDIPAQSMAREGTGPDKDWRACLKKDLEKRGLPLRYLCACDNASRTAKELHASIMEAYDKLNGSANFDSAETSHIHNKWRKLRDKKLEEFAIAEQAAREYANGTVKSEIRKCAGDIAQKIFSFDDISALRKYIKIELEGKLRRLHLDVSKKVIGNIAGPLVDYAENINASFANELGMPVAAQNKIYEYSPRDDDRYSLLRFTRADELDRLPSELNEKLWQGGGVAAGICAAALMPGIGWLAGGALAATGLFMGGFGKSLTHEKKECLKCLDEYFERLSDELPGRIGDHLDFLSLHLEKGLKKSFRRLYEDCIQNQQRQLCQLEQRNMQIAQNIVAYVNCIGIVEQNLEMIGKKLKKYFAQI